MERTYVFTGIAAILLIAAAATVQPFTDTSQATLSTTPYTATVDTAEDWQRGSFAHATALNGVLQPLSVVGTPLYKANTADRDIHSIALSTDEQFFYTITANGVLQQFNAYNGKPSGSLSAPLPGPRAMIHDPWNPVLYVSTNGKLTRINTADSRVDWVEEFRGRSLAAADNGSTLYLGTSQEELVKLAVNASGTTAQWRFTKPRGWVDAVTVDANGFIYLGGSGDTVWKLTETGDVVWNRSVSDDVEELVTAPGAGLYIGLENGVIHRVNPLTGDTRWQDRTGASIEGLAATNNVVYASAENNTVEKRDMETGELLHRFHGHAQTITDLETSRNGLYLYSAGRDGVIRKVVAEPPRQAMYTSQVFRPSSGSTVTWENVTITGEHLVNATLQVSFSDTTRFTGAVVETYPVPRDGGVIALNTSAPTLQFRLVVNATAQPRVDRIQVNGRTTDTEGARS